MAMAGLMKSQGGYSSNSNGGSRGRNYGMLLLMAFGAAVIGVMVLHRFRERRIFNLLIREKDSDLISLQILLQKERDNVKEAKRKLEDMRAKIHTLRSQKRELDDRIMEMHSTVSSLREEQREIESTLEEKENEIKMMRYKNTHIHDENQTLKKGGEAGKSENMKGQLEAPVKILSVSTDDISNASLNSQMEARMMHEGEMSVNQGKEFRGMLKKEAGEHVDGRKEVSGNNSSEEEAAKQGDGGETTQSRKMTEEQYHSMDTSNHEERINNGEGKKSSKSENRAEQVEETAESKAIANHDSEVQRSTDETNESRSLNNKMTETTVDTMLVSNALGAENQEHGANLRREMNPQILDNYHMGRHGRKARNGYAKRAKGRRWTIMSRSKARKSEDNRVAVSLDNSVSQNKSSQVSNETGQNITNPKNGESSKHDARTTTSYQQQLQTAQTDATSTKIEMVHPSMKDAPTNMILNVDDSKTSSEGKLRMHEIEQSEKQATGIQQLEEEIDKKKEDVNAEEQPKTTNLDEEQDSETQDFQEQEQEP